VSASARDGHAQKPRLAFPRWIIAGGGMAAFLGAYASASAPRDEQG
jgi:hypothetical protein